MKQKYLILILVAFWISGQVNAQNCSQKLLDATRAYHAGQFREVAPLIMDCIEKGFDREQRIRALELLINTNLLLNENEQAETYMAELLKVDPLYKVDEADLVEFRNIYDSYEIVTKSAFGFSIGVIRPDYRIIKHQSYSGRTDEPEDYDETLGYFLGFTGELPLIYNVYINASVFYEQRGFEQEEIILDLQRIKSKEREYLINIPIQLKYIYPHLKYRPFVSAGYAYHYLLRAEGDIERFALVPDVPGTPIGVPYSADGYDLTELRRRSTHNWLASVGVQAPLKGGFLLEVKMTYERGLNNLIEEENRFSDPVLLNDFAYVPDDVKVSSWMFSLTLMKHNTKPKKK